MRTRSHAATVATQTDVFWSAADEALFDQNVIAAVLRRSPSWCERCRWDGTGPPFVKMGRSVVYRKREVLQWIAKHPTVRSTSEYQEEV